MKKNILPVAIFISASGLFSCHSASTDSYTITGNISGLKDSLIYFRGHKNDSLFIDSAVVKNGMFTFKGSIQQPYMAAIYLKDNPGNHHFYLYVENANINVSGSADSMQDVKVTGSATQDDYNSLTSSLKGITVQEDSAYSKYQTAQQQKDAAGMSSVEKQIDSLDKIMNAKTIDFIKGHSKSIVSLDQLGTLTYSNDYATLDSLFTALDTSLQNSASGKKLADQLAIMKKTADGQPALPFTQNDVNGKTVNLSDFKGKYVLVDFWASWCGPCRAENPNVVKAYNKYKSKNFNILGVSLDDDGNAWKQAIAKDNLTWTEVSDLKGWKNAAAEQYGVKAIPANFLIDPNGVIVGHNLRGENLESKLAEVLK